MPPRGYPIDAPNNPPKINVPDGPYMDNFPSKLATRIHIIPPNKNPTTVAITFLFPIKSGGPDRTRTCDLFHVKETL